MISASGGAPAAEAIMTSDSCSKEYAVRVTLGGKRITIGGMAKGAGMIHPNMATMLGFLTTDAVIAPRQLKQCLATAVNQSFNRISVDGDMSTNDTVILLANGMAGNKTLDAKSMAVFQAAVNEVALALALMIVRDGEGTSRVVTVEVSGAANDAEAEVACRAVCNSVLVKTSWCGGDPNWGRIMDALGYSSARVREEKITIAYDSVLAVRHGGPLKNNARKLKQIAAQPEFRLSIDLNQGRGRCTMYSTDLTEAYVEFNKSE